MMWKHEIQKESTHVSHDILLSCYQGLLNIPVKTEGWVSVDLLSGSAAGEVLPIRPDSKDPYGCYEATRGIYLRIGFEPRNPTEYRHRYWQRSNAIHSATETTGSGRAGGLRLMGKYIGHRLVARSELDSTFWTDSTNYFLVI